MAILKKPEPKKCKCDLPSGTSASSLNMLMGAASTLPPEESAMRREIDKIRLDTMKADLRLHNAQADLAEVTAARAKADFEEAQAVRKQRPARK